MAYLVLVRHGESEWNKTGIWTGLTDIGLSQKGRQEARQAAEKIKDISLNTVYASILVRAKQTWEEMQKVLKTSNLPIFEDKALNERDYGELTGKSKWDIQKKYGEEKFLDIRRGWSVPIPNGETLKDVYNRVVPYYQSAILPHLKSGKNVAVVAHGNSLRALVKYVENIPDEEIKNLEIPTGQVYIYQIDKDGFILSKQIR